LVRGSKGRAPSVNRRGRSNHPYGWTG